MDQHLCKHLGTCYKAGLQKWTLGVRLCMPHVSILLGCIIMELYSHHAILRRLGPCYVRK